MRWMFLGMTAVGLPLLLAVERTIPWLRRVVKPVASAGFVGLAVSLGAPDTLYGRWILAGLLLGWIGDVALLGASRPAFLAGLGAFLAGHLAYTVGFASRGLATVPLATVIPVALVAGAFVFRWLRPHLPAELVGPVLAYILVISAMIVCAVASAWSDGQGLIPAGALAFYASDLAVARDRFVEASFTNRFWGLPLYYLGQVLLAWSVAA